MVYCFLMKSFTVVQLTPIQISQYSKATHRYKCIFFFPYRTSYIYRSVTSRCCCCFCISRFVLYLWLCPFFECNFVQPFLFIFCYCLSPSLSLYLCLSLPLCLCALLYRCLNIICCYVSKVDDAVAYFVSIYFIFSSLFQFFFFVFWMFLFLFLLVAVAGCRLPGVLLHVHVPHYLVIASVCASTRVLVCVSASVTVGQVIELERRQVTCGLLSRLLPPSLVFMLFFSGLFLCFNARFAAALALVECICVSLSRVSICICNWMCCV